MFEKIDDYTSRLKVPDGWVIRTIRTGAVHQLFIQDIMHVWELESTDPDLETN